MASTNRYMTAHAGTHGVRQKGSGHSEGADGGGRGGESGGAGGGLGSGNRWAEVPKSVECHGMTPTEGGVTHYTRESAVGARQHSRH